MYVPKYVDAGYLADYLTYVTAIKILAMYFYHYPEYLPRYLSRYQST